MASWEQITGKPLTFPPSLHAERHLPLGEDEVQGIQGPEGPTGPEGPEGPQGLPGAQGQPGSQGVKGDTGDTGPEGPQGPQGETGLQGETGSQGPQGAAGSTGAQGETGSQGPAGQNGSQGIQGIQGPAGPEGPQGPQGETGDPGADGQDGAPGTTDWNALTNKPSTFPPAIHNHDAAYAAIGHNHTGTYEPANANLQAHVAAAHAPSNAQRNSDITKAEIEAKLTGVISSHSHSGGSDPWTYVALAADFTTSSATAVDVTGLAFTPALNTRYIFEAVLGVRSATATVNPRPGLAWATGMTDGVATIEQTSTAVAKVMANGNIAAPLLLAVGGIPNNNQSWPALYYGFVSAGASPSGTVRIQLASETAGTVVRAIAGSYLRYRTY